MYYLLAFYIWLSVHRPFEHWDVLATIHLERITGLLLIASWLGSGRIAWGRNAWSLAYTAFTAALLFAWASSSYFDEGIKPVEDWIRILIVWAIILTTVRGERDLRWIVIVFLVATALYLTHSFREYRAGRYEYRMGIVRMIGVDQANSNPNALSGTIIYTLPLTFPFWARFHSLRRRDKFLLIYYTGLSVLCVILTGSRSGFVELVCLATLRLWSTRHRLRMILLLALAVPAGWGLMPENLANRFMTIIDPSVGPKNAQESAEMRTEFFKIGMKLFQESPVTGFGPGSFPLASRTGYSPHNLCVQLLAELGLPGMLAFAGILAGFAANHLAIRRLARGLPPGRGDFARDLSGAILVAIGLMLIQGLAGHNLYRPNWAWYGALQVVALESMRRVREELPDEPAGLAPAEIGGQEAGG